MKQKRNLEWFLDSDISNAWLKEPNLQVYVRSTFRYSNGSRKKTFDVASITTSPTGKGTFTRFLIRLGQELRKTDFELIFIENVIEERFRNFFLRKGYKPVPTGGMTQCFEKDAQR